MPTLEEKQKYRKEFLIGVEEYQKTSSEELWRRLYEGVIATSTNADIRLIGAWVAYGEGIERARWYMIWPSRGQSYALVDRAGNKRFLKVANCRDHRNGVMEVNRGQ